MIVTLGTAALYVAAAGAVAFPLLYLRAQWYRSAVGRDAMLLAVCMAVLLTYLALRVLLFGANVPPEQAIPRVIVYAPLAVLLPRRAVLLWLVQRNPERYSIPDELERKR